MTNSDWSGHRVTVMGLGRFGGGIGVTRYLADRGATVHITDHADEPQLREPITSIADLLRDRRVTLELGGHTRDAFTRTDLVIANPAVARPWENQWLALARDAGVSITSEIRLAIDEIDRRDRIVGVTGTAGKSTTAAMLAAALTHAGRNTWLGGNTGGSLLASLNEIHRAKEPFIVLELSSAQLYWLGEGAQLARRPAWTPEGAIVTNFKPNHLDWHTTLDHYEASKRHILAGRGWCVLGEDVAHWADQTERDATLIHDSDLESLPALAAVGEHNRTNAALAMAALDRLGIDLEAATSAVAAFPGLPHRLELIHEEPGLAVYNDSKCTTPEGVALAIQAIPDDPSSVHLIAGGADKHINLDTLVRAASRCARCTTIGTTGQLLADQINNAGGHAAFAQTLDQAVTRTMAYLRDLPPGPTRRIILLSPGCASWDQFNNYEQRGERFAQLVREGPAKSKNIPNTT